MRGTSINRRGEPPLLDKSESRKRRYSLNRRKSKAEFELELVDEVRLVADPRCLVNISRVLTVLMQWDLRTELKWIHRNYS